MVAYVIHCDGLLSYVCTHEISCNHRNYLHEIWLWTV